MPEDDMSVDDSGLHPLQFHPGQIGTFQTLRNFEIRADRDLANADFARGFLDVHCSRFDGVTAAGAGNAPGQTEKKNGY